MYAGEGIVIHAGIMNYSFAKVLMDSIVRIKRNKPWPEILLLLEHPPVITLGKRSTAEDILYPDNILKSKGIDVHNVERGGLATYHGPGQLVGYILIDLKKINMRQSQLVDHIEAAIIQSLLNYSIDAKRHRSHRGVWVGDHKIASIGIAVRGGITFHGFALNCNPDLSHFDFINPCGLNPGSMTSITRVLGKPTSADEIKNSITAHLGTRIGIDFSSVSLNNLLTYISKEQKGTHISRHFEDESNRIPEYPNNAIATRRLGNDKRHCIYPA